MYNIMEDYNQIHWESREYSSTICFDDFVYIFIVYLVAYKYDIKSIKEYNSHMKAIIRCRK